MNRTRPALPLPGVILIVALAIMAALAVFALVAADCPEPAPAGGCGVDTIAVPTATAPPAPTGEPYPGPDPYPAPYPAPAYLPFVAQESYP